MGTPPSNNALIPHLQEYEQALSNLSLVDVFTDIKNLLNDSHSCWPADTFNSESSYGPLFIRLAWHCAGTFRDTDGLGGCAGGRQRFWPESSWEDNVNLDKARALLAPIKNKYGIGLSWGDLFIFAGTAAILFGDGPVTQICAGRIDSSNGSLSHALHPDNISQACPNKQGNCPEPYGADTIGLIYVNPEGVMGNPDPAESAIRIREIFGRMGMNDTETVALIGGGHAFGKSHGACTNGSGPGPMEQPNDSWPGLCGTGKGPDTYTSGIEGQWTTDPLRWDNEYFTQLIHDNYTLNQGPGGKHQWENDRNGYLMLTTDLALIEDENYLQIVTTFANNITTLNIAFSRAWEKLVKSGGTWAATNHCIDAAELLQSVTTTTTTTTKEPDVSTPDDDGMSETQETWFIIGIVFICCFGVALIVIGYLGYRLYSAEGKDVSDGKGRYKQSDNHGTALAEESD